MNDGRKKLGLALIVLGFVVWALGAAIYLGNVTHLFPTIPYAGFVTTSVGAFAEAIGLSLFRGKPVVEIEKRRTSLVIVLPALLLFAIMLAGAALFFGQNFQQETSGGRWIGSGIFLLISLLLFSALVRDVLSRLGTSSGKVGIGT
jgi:hypothetical protein